ncbi:hypothetical protein [Ammoniphilus sp. YIM 78166]|nr:hypothetical protein [Ammoniphilus sp. YIM 78166]
MGPPNSGGRTPIRGRDATNYSVVAPNPERVAQFRQLNAQLRV